MKDAAPSEQTAFPTTSNNLSESVMERAREVCESLDDVPENLLRSTRYRVIAKLGQGGMGTVYKAVQLNLKRNVVLKVIRPELLNDEQAVQRFRAEALAAAELSHPNIVVTHDADKEGNTHFIVLAFVDGFDLAKLVRNKGPLSIHYACNFVSQAAAGLQHADEHGTVHRDIKPQNLMVSKKGHVTILDFGLARLAQGKVTNAGQTAPGSVMGTPDYMSPEQAFDTRSVDIRADIYSLGCTLYFLLTGQRVFPRQTALEVLMAHAKDAPLELAEVVEKMLAKKREDRYQKPAEVMRALHPFRSSAAPAKSGPVPIAPPAESPSVMMPPTLPLSQSQVSPFADITDETAAIVENRVPETTSNAKRPWNLALAVGAGAALAMLAVVVVVIWFQQDKRNSEIVGARSSRQHKSATYKAEPESTELAKTNEQRKEEPAVSDPNLKTDQRGNNQSSTFVKGSTWVGPSGIGGGATKHISIIEMNNNEFTGTLVLVDKRSFQIKGTVNGRHVEFDTERERRTTFYRKYNGVVDGKTFKADWSGKGTKNDIRSGSVTLTLNER